jgi:MYXO-CTERM domain-containing protein
MTQMIIKTVGSNDGTVKPGQVQPTPLASAGLWFLPAGVLGGLLWWRRRQLSAAAKQMLMTLVMMAGAMGVIGCGYPVPHVPVGSPTVTITATGANGVSQSTTVTLIITQ